MSAMATPPPAERSTRRQGNYAGAVSRGAAFGADVGISWGLYTLAAGGLGLFVQLVAGHTIKLDNHPVVATAILALWEFFYFAAQWSLGGQTLGMAIFGLRVVRTEGSRISPKQAAIRTLVLPISIAVLFLGFVGILTNRQRKAWHDHAAGTVVVYDWDARAAHLRWLAHHDVAAKGSSSSESAAA